MPILWIIRHGETVWNAEGRVQGQTDVPLSEVGFAQSQAIARVLVPPVRSSGESGFAAIYSSDLLRARQTADPVARKLGLPMRLDPALRERHYGMFETLTYAEVRERYPEDYARFRMKDPEYDFRGGEGLRAFFERCMACLTGIAARHVGDEILIFTHGGVLEMAFRNALGLGLSSKRDFEIPNAALNRIEVTGSEWKILLWADCAHLETALDDLPD